MTEEKYFFEKSMFSSKNYEFTFEYDETLIHELSKYKTSGNVLDLGCGEGGTSLHLAEKGFDVTCIDISKTAIKKLNKEARKRNLKIKTVVADLESFDFEEKYDVILALGVFHFFSEGILKKLLLKIKNNTINDGLNVFEAFLEGDPSQEDSEGNYFKKHELKKLYADWKIIKYKEYEKYDEDEDCNNKLAYLMAKKRR